jgi:hypothetical protein
MNTIESGRFEDTNKIFEQPEQVDYEIKNYNYMNTLKDIRDKIKRNET